VTLRLPLQEGLLETNQRFYGTLYIHGYDNLELGLTVWADAPSPDLAGSTAAPAEDEAPKKKSSSRKTAVDKND
jgi:hypothetical protein